MKRWRKKMEEMGSEEPRRVKRSDNVREMSITDLVDYCIQRGLDPNEVVLTAAYLKWESVETDLERARRLEWAAEHEARTEKWEREMYARLKGKYETIQYSDTEDMGS